MAATVTASPVGPSPTLTPSAAAAAYAARKEIKTKCEAWIQARLASKQSIKADK